MKKNGNQCTCNQSVSGTKWNIAYSALVKFDLLSYAKSSESHFL